MRGSSSPAFARAVRFSRVGAERIARGTGPALADTRVGIARFGVIAAGRRRRRHFADAVRDVFENVEPRYPLRREQFGRVGFLLQGGSQDVARLHFLTTRALTWSNAVCSTRLNASV